jgi:transketolase
MPNDQIFPTPKPIGQDELVKLLELSLRVREGIVQVVFDSGSGHIGGALSQTDILCALYARYLHVDPARPSWPERDRFVLSKGHGGLGFVVLLAERGFIAREDLATFGRTGSALGMHLDRRRVPGVEASTGSLGHGLGVAVGMARGAELQGLPSRVVCLLSDGECYEGSTWEAAFAASAMKLGRLVAIIDRNRMTMDGPTETEVPLEPLADKWKAFGFRVYCCDGHSFSALTRSLDAAFDSSSNQPAIVIAETIKGKGVDFMEGRSEWHYGSIDSEHRNRALASLRATHERAVQAIGGAS